MRIGNALAVALLILIFFVPLVPYGTRVICSSEFCQLIPPGGFYTGFNSLGSLIFNWGASLDTSFSVATYVPPSVMTTRGGNPSQLTAFGVSLFILLPIALFIAALLTPEEWHIIQRFRAKQ